MLMAVCEKGKITLQNIDLDKIYFEKMYKTITNNHLKELQKKRKSKK